MQSPSRPTRRPLFTGEDGTPICIFIDSSVKREHHRRQLREDIENHGGIVIDTDEGADTVISLKREERRYAQDLTYICSDMPARKKTWVEHPSWIRLSIEAKMCEHRSRDRKGMGGGALGKKLPFTPEEEEKLCKYLAKRIPDGAAGGRRGEGVYRELAVMASQSGPDGEFSWANNHPWQSWRNRFNKNYERLNPKVDAFAADAIVEDRQLYHLDRRLNKRTSAIDPSLLDEEEEEEEYDEAYNSAVSFVEEEHRAARKAKRSLDQRRRSRQMQKRRAEPVESEADSGDDIARSRRKGRRNSSLFSDDDRQKSPLFSGGEEANFQPLKDGNIVPFQPDDRDYEPILGEDFGPFEEFQPGSDSEDLPPGPSAFLSSQKTLVEQPISTGKSIPSSVSRHIRQTQQEPHVQNPEPQAGPSQPSRQLPSWVSLDDASDGRASPALSDPGAPSPPPRPTSSPSKAAVKTPQPLPKKPSQKRKALTPPNDPPARNTRARSKSLSVEPPMQLPLPVKKRKKQPELPPVVEVPPEPIPNEEDIGWPDDGNEVQGDPLPPIPHVDTVSSATSNQVDEMDVQDQLIADVTNSHVSGDEQDQDEEESTLESDDAQVDHSLRNPGTADESISQFPPSVFDTSITNVLANLVNHYTDTMNPSQASGSRRIPQPSFHTGQPASRRASNAPFTPPTFDLQRITPRHRPSSSSEDIFPIRGTRASAIKEKIQEIDKTTPYKPPPGTKAARFRGEEETAEEARPATQKRGLRPRQK